MSEKIKIKRLDNLVALPIKGSEKAGAYDIYAREINRIDKNYVVVKVGFKTEIPDGYKVLLTPRSNLTQTNWIINNSPGTIDSDYRGEWQIRFRGIPTGVFFDSILNQYVFEYDLFPYQVGDRVAQFFLLRDNEFEFEEVYTLETTNRGEGGFGSSGLR